MVTNYHKEEPQPATMMVNEGDKDIVAKILQWKEDSEGGVGTWETNQEKWHKLRMRIKKTKTFPFTGCSNIRMPTVETKLRKLKAALVNVIFGVRPIVSVTPTPSGNWNAAKKIEKFMDWLIMDIMKLKPKAVISIDQTLEKGFYILKPHWRVETMIRHEKVSLEDLSVQEAQQLFNPQVPKEALYPVVAQRLQMDANPMVRGDNMAEVERVTNEIINGASEVSFKLEDVLYNYPDVALRPPERIYVPTTTGYDPQGAEYIIDEFLLPLSTIKQRTMHDGWSTLSVSEIEAKQTVDLNDKNIDVDKDQREGIERLQGEGSLVKVQECYTNYDFDGTGEYRWKIVTIAPDFYKKFREIDLPFWSGKRPFVKLFYELIDDRWFSHRGIAELIEDIVKEIDIAHMQKIDYQTLANSPIFTFRAGMIAENTQQFLFGQGIPVRGLDKITDTIAPLNLHNPNIEFSYEREQMILETKVEELIGQVDFSLQSMINKRQPRTLGEVEMQQQNMQQVFSLDADLFTQQFSELFNWIYDLWCQYGDEEVAFGYFGQNGYENLKMTREEVQGKYKITVRGNDQNTNPVVKQQKASFILQDAYQSFQMGIVGPQAVLAAKKRALQEMGIEGWEEFLQPPQPQPQPDDIKLKGDDLTDAETAQALEKRGIKPDMKGRAYKAKKTAGQEKFDQLEKVAKTLK